MSSEKPNEAPPQEGGTHVRMPDGRLVKVPEGAADPVAAAQAVLDAEAAVAATESTEQTAPPSRKRKE